MKRDCIDTAPGQFESIATSQSLTRTRNERITAFLTSHIGLQTCPKIQRYPPSMHTTILFGQN